jgi:hypothetical protein
MLSDKARRSLTPGERAGVRAHRGRGLCSLCYDRAWRDGTLIDHERRSTPSDLLLDEALWLVEERGLRYRDLPQAFGMTREAFTRAVRRGVQRGDHRAVALANLNTYPTKGSAA